MNLKSAIVLQLLLFPILLLADQVSLNDGREYDGAIIGSDANFINLQVDDTTTVRIPHGLVEKVFFRYADMIYMLSKEEIKCKIIEEEIPNLRIITAAGERLIKLVDIKDRWINITDSLIAPSLPLTGNIFNNEKSLRLIRQPFRQSLFLSLSGGIIYPPAQEWQDNFLTSISLTGVTAQGQIGVSLIENISVYFGYSFSQYDNTAGDLESTLQTQYIHGGVKYSKAFDFLPMIEFSVGGDLGLMSIGGELYSYSFRKLTLDNLTANIAYRPEVGARASIMDRLFIYLNFGYLVAQEFKTQVPEVPDTEIKIPISGVTIYAGITYHIPLKLW
jgi:hypothetical protein